MATDRIISADNHVYEAPDLWTSRVEPRFRDRAPHLVVMEDGDFWLFEGVKRVGVGPSTQLGTRFDEPEKLSLKGRYENVVRGGYLPEEHVKDNENDGIDLCVLYPTVGLRTFSIPDSELLSAVCRAYNDWIAEFCNAIPKRLKGLGMINLDEVQVGIKELERCQKLGLVGANITVYPPEGRSYDSPEYEPFWAAAQDLEMPLSLHIGTNRPGPNQQFSDIEAIDPAFICNIDHWVRMSLAHMIYSGVFERYPNLIVGSAEMDLAWAPHFIQAMDYIYAQRPLDFARYRFKEDMLPSDYFRRNVFLGFQEDAMGIRHRELIGIDNLLWGSDYPHFESTYPRSREIIEEIMADCTPEEKSKIVCDNAIRLYNLE